MIKLTRLNNHVVAINPDHIGWADATPDTTLFLIGGEKIIIRETLEELIDQVIEFRRRVRAPELPDVIMGVCDGDPPRVSVPPRSVSEPPRSTRYSNRPRGGM